MREMIIFILTLLCKFTVVLSRLRFMSRPLVSRSQLLLLSLRKGQLGNYDALQEDSAQNFGTVPWRRVIPVGDLGHLARPLRPSFTAAGVRGLP